MRRILNWFKRLFVKRKPYVPAPPTPPDPEFLAWRAEQTFEALQDQYSKTLAWYMEKLARQKQERLKQFCVEETNVDG